jgi:hypothetical protein
MFLDKSRIPCEKLNDPRLKKIEEDVLQAMQVSTYRRHSCLHEAAHGVYLVRAGAKRLIYHGPVAIYDAESDTFDIGDAGIQGDFGEHGVNCDPLKMARWYVAGGVATRILTAWSDEEGDGRDFEEFVRQCPLLIQEISREGISELWEQAKKDVERDLRSPAFRQELWRRARDFEAWLSRI